VAANFMILVVVAWGFWKLMGKSESRLRAETVAYEELEDSKSKAVRSKAAIESYRADGVALVSPTFTNDAVLVWVVTLMDCLVS